MACTSAPPGDPTVDPGGSDTEGGADGAATAASSGAADTTGTGDGSGGSNPSPTTDADDTTGAPPDPNDDVPAPDEEGCHAIYAQDHLPTFEVTVHPAVWEQLQWEWDHGQAIEDAGQDPKVYHSLLEFRYGDVVIHDARIRLRGNATYWDPWPGDKMQFQIAFDQIDPDGRMLGLRKLALDAHTYNRHLLRDRLGLAFMRKVGVRAPCANNARLMVNGEYYGIFTNVEKLDDVFLQRTMEDPTGDLWKRANWELKTNEGATDDARLDAMRDATTLAELDAYLDLEQALRTFAAEAVVPHSDGAWAGGLNGYYYDDPERGKFMLLPWDLDSSFEYFNDPPDGEYPTNPDPVTWEKPTTHGRPFFDLALSDPMWFQRYIEIIDEIVHDGYEPDPMLEWIDQWSAQIEQAVLEDVNKPYDDELYYDKLEELREYVLGRHAFLEAWLACWQGGGMNDGTGVCVP
ncbi:CotH kinase family protein [Paraliomyxa miuraensis]|uniref:CotH kinase family protein n=1 Tax=Paraliomyxa miuraensis TaxID=376150 RepID=UPI00224FFE9E|nr:CotH kinase family protein [Paraliomyxa miuraensis]MCX4245952.1 CotH kinase family protein [Paraliomyxa miuraensis]